MDGHRCDDHLATYDDDHDDYDDLDYFLGYHYDGDHDDRDDGRGDDSKKRKNPFSDYLHDDDDRDDHDVDVDQIFRPNFWEFSVEKSGENHDDDYHN